MFTVVYVHIDRNRYIRDEEPGTAISTFTQLLSFVPMAFYLLLSWCFTSTETTRLIRDGEGGGGDLVPMSSSSQRSDP